MTSLAQLKEQALALVGAQSDKELVDPSSRSLTPEMDAKPDAEHRQHVAEVRGWLMNELERRGKLDLVMPEVTS